MSKAIRMIRRRLGVTQDAMAAAIGCSAPNIHHYEQGQTLPPERAARLIEWARSLGLALTWDHVYGGAELPMIRRVEVVQ